METLSSSTSPSAEPQGSTGSADGGSSASPSRVSRAAFERIAAAQSFESKAGVLSDELTSARRRAHDAQVQLPLVCSRNSNMHACDCPLFNLTWRIVNLCAWDINVQVL